MKKTINIRSIVTKEIENIGFFLCSLITNKINRPNNKNVFAKKLVLHNERIENI